MPELDALSTSGASGNAKTPRTPDLENGDCLARREFERRYAARPDVKKTELVEGVVYMPSPVRLVHSGPHAMIQTVFQEGVEPTEHGRFVDRLTDRG